MADVPLELQVPPDEEEDDHGEEGEDDADADGEDGEHHLLEPGGRDNLLGRRGEGNAEK